MTAQKNKIILLLQQIALLTEKNSKGSLSDNTARWALQARLAPVLVDTFLTTDLTPALVQQLKADALTTKFWFQTQYQATLELVTELNKQKITPTLLKGMSISTAFYPKPYYRNMRDIDLLVEQQQLKQVEQIMRVLGYEQKSHLPDEFYKTHHHTKPWRHKTKDIWLEIHTGLVPASSPCSAAKVFSLATINSEKQLNNIDGKEIYRLNPELQIVYIATHWADELKQTGGLFAFADIALIINNTQPDYKKLIHLSSEPYIANAVYILLSYLLKNGLLRDSAIRPYLKKISHSLVFFDQWLVYKFIDHYLITGKPFGRMLTINNIGILWKLLLSPLPAGKKLILIPVYIAFPPQANKKFNLNFQLSRIKRLLFKSS